MSFFAMLKNPFLTEIHIFLQMQLDDQARLVAERGMVLVGNEEEDEQVADLDSKTADEEQEKRTRAIVSSDTATILGGLGSGPLDVRIKRLADERDDLQDNLRRLKMDLEEEKNRNQRLEKTPSTPEDIERETKRVVDDYKFKMQKSEQDIQTLQTTVSIYCLKKITDNFSLQKFPVTKIKENLRFQKLQQCHNL
jgi:hypothetical protein